MCDEKNTVLGVLAHVDAGKTTLCEALLYLSGKLKKLGRVDHRDSFLDTHSLERERGITIFSKQAVLPLGDGELTLLFRGECSKCLILNRCTAWIEQKILERNGSILM